MLMNDVQPRADSDSEESLAESESDSSDDEFGPTRRDAREAGDGTDDGDAYHQNDSDSEVDENDEEDQPQEQPDQWIDLGNDDWTPTWQNFAYRDQPKLLFDVEGFKPVDYFTKFFPDDVFELMARQTNLYAKQTIGRYCTFVFIILSIFFNHIHDTVIKILSLFRPTKVYVST